MHLLKAWYKACLRRNMEYLLGAVEKVGTSLQKEPYESVAFKRETVGTQSIRSGPKPPVGQEAPEALPADRAGNRISRKEKSGYL